MAHQPDNELLTMIAEAEASVPVGSRYVHYKNRRAYEVVGHAIIEATNEVAVVYKAEYGAKVTFCRPLTVWQEKVEVNGRPVQRFSPYT